MKIDRSKLSQAGSSIQMSPGEMVKTLRTLKGLSQLELAQITGISQTNISAIENERINVGKERSITLAIALGVHPSAIMFADFNELKA